MGRVKFPECESKGREHCHVAGGETGIVPDSMKPVKLREVGMSQPEPRIDSSKEVFQCCFQKVRKRDGIGNEQKKIGVFAMYALAGEVEIGCPGNSGNKANKRKQEVRNVGGENCQSGA